MIRKKIFILPLLVLSLTIIGCNPKDSSEPSEITSQSSETKPITTHEANVLVATALTSSFVMNATTMDTDIEADFTLKTVEYIETPETPVAVNEYDVEAIVNVKGKDLDTLSPILYVDGEGNIGVKEDEGRMNYGGRIDAYYVEEWVYADYRISTKEGNGPTTAVEDQIKVNVGPLNEEIDLTDLPLDSGEMDYDSLVAILDSIDSIDVKEEDTELHVTYHVTQKDIVDILIEEYLKDFPPGVLTSELTESIIVSTEAYVSEFLTIRKGDITIVLSNDGEFRGFKSDLDFDFVEKPEEYSTEPSEVELNKNFVKTTYKGTLDAVMKFNGPVEIALPDFSNYREEALATIFI